MVSKTHFLAFLLISVVVAITGQDVGIAKNNIDEIQPTPPTEKPTTPAPTTAPTTPITPTTPTTTAAPKPTTTPEPTHAPTPPPTTSTSTPPTSTSTPSPQPPTTTVAPITTPPPPTSDWIVRGENNTICIIAKMVIKINVKYPIKTNETNCTKIEINKVEDATASGFCSNDKQTLVLTTNTSLKAEFQFVRNTTENKTYSLSNITLTIPVDELKGINTTEKTVVVSYPGKVFSVSLDKSYSCANMDKLSLNGTTNNRTLDGTITLFSVHAEAFGKKNSTSYSAAEDCQNSVTPDIVPIVVGLVLAGLVIVVLVAYLVGRRRAQARGYLSM